MQHVCAAVHTFMTVCVCVFRLLVEANDVSYCIHAFINLCPVPFTVFPFTHHLASVISLCNESSSAHQRLKMILEILIRGPF